MDKIIAFFSTTPATIITTIIVLALLIAFFWFFYKETIILFFKKKYDLYDETDIVDFIEDKINSEYGRYAIRNKLFTHNLNRKEKQ